MGTFCVGGKEFTKLLENCGIQRDMKFSRNCEKGPMGTFFPKKRKFRGFRK